MLKKTTQDYFIAIVSKMIKVMCGLITSVIINRYLGTTLKGEYAYFINIINITVVLGNLGFQQSYPYQKKCGMKEQCNKYVTLFFMQFFLYMIIALIFIVVSQYNAWIAILIIPIQILSQQTQMVIMIENFSVHQVIIRISDFIELMLYIIIYFFSEKSLYCIFVVIILKNIFLVLCGLKKIHYIPKVVLLSEKEKKVIFKFGILSMMAALLNTLNYRLDIIMLNTYVDYTEVGLYATGVSLAEYIWMIPDTFKDVIFNHNAQNKNEKEICIALKVSLFLSTACILIFFALGKNIIRFLYGYEYVNAYEVTSIIFLGIPCMVIFKIISAVVVSDGKQKVYLHCLSISVISNFILNLVLIPKFGKIGAARSEERR